MILHYHKLFGNQWTKIASVLDCRWERLVRSACDEEASPPCSVSSRSGYAVKNRFRRICKNLAIEESIDQALRAVRSEREGETETETFEDICPANPFELDSPRGRATAATPCGHIAIKAEHSDLNLLFSGAHSNGEPGDELGSVSGGGGPRALHQAEPGFKFTPVPRDVDNTPATAWSSQAAWSASTCPPASYPDGLFSASSTFHPRLDAIVHERGL
jgi:hypothetical protein